MPFAPRLLLDWQLRTRTLPLGRRTLIMGILNVTPDSFSDGGQYLDSRAAVNHALQMLDQGADILDVGGESTRPGSTPLSADEEQSRILPVISNILASRPDAILSIDTYHAATARLAITAGAEIVNDVSGLLWDADMAPTIAHLRPGLVLMHTRGRPSDWPALPALNSDEVMPLILNDLTTRLHNAAAAGIQSHQIAIDPGIGFGKHLDENLPILAHLHQLRRLNLPILVGSSRKRFLRNVLASNSSQRAQPSASAVLPFANTAADVAAILGGGHILRVHDVAPAREAASIADAILLSVT